MAQKKLTTSVFGRTVKLLGSAGRVATKEMTQRLSSKKENGALNRISQAEDLVKTLSELKGAAMKAGQMLSLEGQDFLPPEVLKVFSKLHDQAAPMDWAVILERIKSQLGDEALEKLKHLSKEPIAAASMGQVHSAELNGEDVVLKIQYPGIAKTIVSDMRVLKRLAQNLVHLSGKKADLGPLFEEMTSVLKIEADYSSELLHLQFFHNKLEHHSHLLVPRPYLEYCSAEILTLERIYAPTLGQWLDSRPSSSAKEKIAHHILDLYCLEFFEWGRVQTDPNLGNFLVLPEERLALIDFGATLVYDEDFRQNYRELLLLAETGDYEQLLLLSQKFGLLDEKEDFNTKQAFSDMIEMSIVPFHKSGQPFVFHDVDYAKRVRQSAIKFSRLLKYTAPPQKLIFLHRKLGGVFNILKKMEVAIDLRPYWQRMMQIQ